jgi:ACR3 family arsenite efflux pump ArsB
MNRKLIRNLTVFAALIAIAFIAKMEAINFLLALPIGIAVTVYGFKLQEKARQWAEERIDPSLPWFALLAFNVILDATNLRIYILLPMLAGLASGYAVYFTLNALFISP